MNSFTEKTHNDIMIENKNLMLDLDEYLEETEKNIVTLITNNLKDNEPFSDGVLSSFYELICEMFNSKVVNFDNNIYCEVYKYFSKNFLLLGEYNNYIYNEKTKLWIITNITNQVGYHIHEISIRLIEGFCINFMKEITEFDFYNKEFADNILFPKVLNGIIDNEIASIESSKKKDEDKKALIKNLKKAKRSTNFQYDLIPCLNDFGLLGNVKDKMDKITNNITKSIKKASKITKSSVPNEIYKLFIQDYKHNNMSLYKVKIEEMNKIPKYKYCFPLSYNYCLGEKYRCNGILDVENMVETERHYHHSFTYSLERCYIKDSPEKREFKLLLEDYFKYEDVDGTIKLDEEVYACFRKAIGYGLTSDVSLKKIFILLGDSDTGKSSLFNFINKAFDNNQIVSSVSSDILIQGNKSHIKSCYEKLDKGLNLGYLSELKDNQKFNDDSLKSLSGEDDITYRPFGKTDKSFKNRTKLFIFTNEIPNFCCVSNAFIKRLVFFPFRYDFSKHATKEDRIRKNKFEERFHDEKFSVFVDWIKEFLDDPTLSIPDVMDDFKKQIEQDKNPLQDFIDSLTITMNQDQLNELFKKDKKERDEVFYNGQLATSKIIYDWYKIHAENDGVKNIYSKRTFINRLKNSIIPNISAKNVIRIGEERDRNVFACVLS